MMKLIKILMIIAVVFCSINSTAAFAERHPSKEIVKDVSEFGLSDDGRLARPKEQFTKALDFERKGNRHFRGKPGHALKMYEHAEDYFLDAEYLYTEIGQDEGIDVSHDVSMCREEYRKAHVLFGEARKKAKW